MPQYCKPPRHLADLTLPQREEFFVQHGYPAFRARQVSRQYFARYTSTPEEMSDIPSAMHEWLRTDLFPQLLTPVSTQLLESDKTTKTLWKLHDSARIESVLMTYHDRVTMCVSSQAGCGMACPFCATGQLGLQRNLSVAEIVDQVVQACRGLKNRINNIVFMGMGEPLANYRAVTTAIRRIVDPTVQGLGISARSITVSTVGLVPGITALAEENLPVTLAISLHAPDDELRNTLVPVNQRFPVDEVLDGAYAYFSRTGRRVSVEYILINEVNDQLWRADLLADLLQQKGRGWVHVNLIPLNPTAGSTWVASETTVASRFNDRLRSLGIPTTIRDTRGRDIDGACGQLAAGKAVSEYDGAATR